MLPVRERAAQGETPGLATTTAANRRSSAHFAKERPALAGRSWCAPPGGGGVAAQAEVFEQRRVAGILEQKLRTAPCDQPHGTETSAPGEVVGAAELVLDANRPEILDHGRSAVAQTHADDAARRSLGDQRRIGRTPIGRGQISQLAKWAAITRRTRGAASVPPVPRAMFGRMVATLMLGSSAGA